MSEREKKYFSQKKKKKKKIWGKTFTNDKATGYGT